MQSAEYYITPNIIESYVTHLHEQEKSKATIQKYRHDIFKLGQYLAGRPVSREEMIEWKMQLSKQYAPSSVNSMLAAINSFFHYLGWCDFGVKQIRVQKSLFLDEEKELTREEYTRLVRTAERQENERLSLVIQTICATGIRVSELRFITVEAVQKGRTEITNKGKTRTAFITEDLQRLLRKYIRKQKKTTGPVFTTRTGKPLDRSNIWRAMKALCISANVDPGKVFPHNLRHLFARMFYSLEKDIARLADILGHTNISTTRIYTAESGTVHARQMQRLKLIIT